MDLCPCPKAHCLSTLCSVFWQHSSCCCCYTHTRAHTYVHTQYSKPWEYSFPALMWTSWNSFVISFESLPNLSLVVINVSNLKTYMHPFVTNSRPNGLSHFSVNLLLLFLCLQPPLIQAIFSGDPEEIRLLIYKSEDINALVRTKYKCFFFHKLRKLLFFSSVPMRFILAYRLTSSQH